MVHYQKKSKIFFDKVGVKLKIFDFNFARSINKKIDSNIFYTIMFII